MTAIDPRPAMAPSAPTEGPPAGSDSLSGQRACDTQRGVAAEGTSSPQATPGPAPTPGAPAGTTTITPPANRQPASKARPPEGEQHGHGQGRSDTQTLTAVAGDIPGSQNRTGIQRSTASGEQAPPAANSSPAPRGAAPLAGYVPFLASPFLSLLADVLDDQEKARIANENRLRQLTGKDTDKDGVQQAFGLTATHPSVRALAVAVRSMRCDSAVATAIMDAAGLELERKAGAPCCLEHAAERNLTAALKGTPLWRWAQTVTGCGDKQFARLIGTTGDPYIRSDVGVSGVLSMPRTLSQWRSYCGHGDPARRPFKGMSQADAKALGNPVAKMRAHLIAESIVKASVRKLDAADDKDGYDVANRKATSALGQVYLDARAAYADRVHADRCVRCGPSGHPALPGSPWSPKHQNAAAQRLVAKTFLDDLWREAKRLHEEAGR